MTRAVIVTDRAREVDAEVRGDRLLVPVEQLEDATGWHLEPQGLCQGDVCVPVKDPDALVSEGLVDIAALGSALHRPTAVDAADAVAAMAEPASDRAAALQSLQAPDFTLPDMEERPVSLSDFTGKKKLLVAWASW